MLVHDHLLLLLFLKSSCYSLFPNSCFLLFNVCFYYLTVFSHRAYGWKPKVTRLVGSSKQIGFHKILRLFCNSVLKIQEKKASLWSRIVASHFLKSYLSGLFIVGVVCFLLMFCFNLLTVCYLRKKSLSLFKISLFCLFLNLRYSGVCFLWC